MSTLRYHNPNRDNGPSFGFLAVVLLLFIAVVSLSACNTFQTPAERREARKCARAERHMGRAAFLCPDALRLDSTTTVLDVVLDADTASGHAIFTDTLGDLCDSIAAANADLRSALLWLDSARMVENEFAERVAQAQVENARAAVQAAERTARQRACHFEPIEQDDPLFNLRIWSGPKGPLWELRLKERTVKDTVTVATAPTLSIDRADKAPIVRQGVNEIWKWVAMALALTTLAFFMLWRNALNRLK